MRKISSSHELKRYSVYFTSLYLLPKSASHYEKNFANENENFLDKKERFKSRSSPLRI